MVPPRAEGEKMKLQIFSLILQIISVMMLLANIVHHW